MRWPPESDRLRSAGALAAVSGLTLLPFLRGVLSGATLYFRDLSLQFLPLRRFALAGLARGELRFWNPYVHEGIPLSLPPVGYPLDLLQLWRPDERGISLVLLLHVPLAAAFFFLMLRGLGQSRLSASSGALVYGLGGFLLSTVNLYVYLEAAAWAPLAVLGLVRVGESHSRRAIALAAAAVALSLSTTGLEVALQALLIGVVLGCRREGLLPRVGKHAVTLALGAALAAPVLVVVASQVAGSARDRGFATEVVLAHSVHPFTLLQTLVAGLYGDPSNLANVWWGQNFFPRGFPYVLSLYLGAGTLAVAAAGALAPGRWRGRVVSLAAAAVIVSLGRWAALGPVVEAFPLLRSIRYPVKAFFTVHFAIAFLVALGVAALEADERRPWRRLAAVAGATGAVLVGTIALPTMAPRAVHSFVLRFFPSELALPTREAFLRSMLGDAALGGTMALLVAALAFAVLRRALPPALGAPLIAAIVAGDLVRAGGGLNPMVRPEILRLSPELSRALPRLRGGRVFTCAVDESASYAKARANKPGRHEVWSFETAIETLTPFSNVPLQVASALSPDLTMLVPESRIPTALEASCRDLPATLRRAQPAAVRYVLSLDPLQDAALRAETEIAPRRIAPLVVHVYRLESARPWIEVRDGGPASGRISARRQGDALSVEFGASAAGTLVLREAHANGWRAWLDGQPAAIEIAEGHYMSLAIPSGRHAAVFRYRPPNLGPATAVFGFALALAIGLSIPRRGPRDGTAS